MEHLPTVDGQYAVRVKYRHHEFYRYDQAGFMEFPKRKNLDVRRLREEDCQCLMQEGLKAFIQAWLFFGLLSEFSPSPGKIDIESFITRADTGETVITTENLMTYLSEWKKDMKRRASRSQMSKLVLMLNTTKKVIYSIAEINWIDDLMKLGNEDYLLIGAPGETLQWVLVEE